MAELVQSEQRECTVRTGKWDLPVSVAVSCWVGLDHCFLGQAGKLWTVLGREKEAWKLLTDNPIQYP